MRRRKRPRPARRITGVAVGVLAVVLAFPSVASAAPVTVIPGLPPVEIPGLPSVITPKITPTAPKLTPTPTTPKTTQTPTTTRKPKPWVPAIPNVRTSTGYVALALDSKHTIYWWHNGKLVRQMPISMGSNKHPTPNGVYHTKEKYRDMYMDSSTYGVPIDSPEGYRTYVEYATLMSWDGIFIHGAPWSEAQQGNSNVSHGCINVTNAYAKWVYDNVPQGTPIVVRGTIGGQYTGD
ncbi:L,D-transpeptidase [Gordonia sp. (in: high G+C Gram-positive bacteria)]|uniref:L,D-transpeptidase n=1 Tax=Gordonia sp. (in: high G+C Gram-positive bacteria) TaxID=84139 RepID=UPI0019C8A55F|nr:L,D-transpeptidase [Gordonia sp. (in: high G+C Gram-positive bacteria)]MBD0023506.1 L,D-transpeptidase [Gordonia sp. (in: high G+C Gram-positive bacteria)]